MNSQKDLFKGEASGIIGVDEAGKGDYFGPLVISACFADEKIERTLRGLQLRESKKVSDGRAILLDKKIKEIAPNEVIVIGPEKYNQLYDRIKNLNKLLAWGHARALENLLTRVNPIEVISDQFGDKRLLENTLFAKGRQVKLTQMPRAEVNVAVAAASILARAEFLRRLRELSTQYGMDLPKGAGSAVDEAGQSFIGEFGRGEFGKVAKLHFKNTIRVLGTS